MWNLYEPPEEHEEASEDEAGHAESELAELQEAHPDFPTLTDCPFCGGPDVNECGCVS